MVGQLHFSAPAVCESLSLSQMSLILFKESLVLPLAQAEPHLEVHLAAVNPPLGCDVLCFYKQDNGKHQPHPHGELLCVQQVSSVGNNHIYLLVQVLRLSLSPLLVAVLYRKGPNKLHQTKPSAEG